jgi:hypothetical protein
MVQSTSQSPRPQRQERLRRILVSMAFTIGLFAVGFLSGGWIARLIPNDADVQISLPLLLLIAIGGLFSVIVVHELGHVLGGRLVGFRFRLLIVGPFKIDRIDTRLRLGWNRSVALAGGIAAASPTDDRDLIRRMLVYVAGGPAMSLIFGATALLLQPFTDGTLAFVLSMVGLASLAIALVTLIPMRSDGFSSDGARIRMLLRGGPEAERWCAVALLANDLFVRRPRDLPPALIERALSLPDNSPDHLSSVFVAFSWALDSGNTAQAERYLEDMLANLATFNSALRPSVLIEAAYFTAQHRNDAVGARDFLTQARGGLVEAHTRARAEAAVLLAEGRRSEARSIAADGLARLRRAAAGPASLAEADILEAILRTTDGENPDR